MVLVLRVVKGDGAVGAHVAVDPWRDGGEGTQTRLQRPAHIHVAQIVNQIRVRPRCCVPVRQGSHLCGEYSAVDNLQMPRWVQEHAPIDGGHCASHIRVKNGHTVGLRLSPIFLRQHAGPSITHVQDVSHHGCMLDMHPDVMMTQVGTHGQDMLEATHEQ